MVYLVGQWVLARRRVHVERKTCSFDWGICNSSFVPRDPTLSLVYFRGERKAPMWQVPSSLIRVPQRTGTCGDWE